MSKEQERDGLSLWYRFTWRLKYTLLTFFGPPRLDARQDPQTRMEAQRAARVAEARAARQSQGSSDTA
ncbi:hypothetical protein [Serinicoccus profundi]|uniref:hypothetical protein n=1 Tax=Serinicoccus profundi TaxID=1078471 RepID=UPI000255E31E|nr:hypothetical protein [Serinicoccus profundi]